MIALIYLLGVVSLLVGGIALLVTLAFDLPDDDDDLMPPAF